MASPTQDTWHNNDYVTSFRLVYIVILNWVGGALYVHIGWSIQTCAITLVITSSSHFYHISNILYQHQQLFLKMLDARSFPFHICLIHICLFSMCLFITYLFRTHLFTHNLLSLSLLPKLSCMAICIAHFDLLSI